MKTDVNVLLSIVQAGINNCVLINAVDSNGKLKINENTNDILKIQKVDGSTLYDSSELSCNTIDKTSILKINNIDILESLNLKASASNVYTTQEINDFDNTVATSLNTTADKSFSIFED